MSERQFTLQYPYNSRRRADDPLTIPWSLAEEAWRGYAKAGHGSQSLERIAQRGGFSLQEAACALRGHYNDCSNDHTACVAFLKMRLMGHDGKAPWWPDFQKGREGDSHAVAWARNYAGLFALGEPGNSPTPQQFTLLAQAFIEMSKRFDALSDPTTEAT